jgi:hypothetical protein
MSESPAPRTPTPAPNPTGREILRMGLWNYISSRWAPKNSAGKWVFEIGILVVFFLVLAILAKLAQG